MKSFFLIIFRLSVPEPAVESFCRQQLFMGALFLQPAAFEDQNPVAEPAAGEAMGDIERPFALHKTVHPLIDVAFRHRIQ